MLICQEFILPAYGTVRCSGTGTFYSGSLKAYRYVTAVISWFCQAILTIRKQYR
jgi:hypothetical protein